MNDLERIESALESDHIDHDLFEECAQDLLTELFPGLSAIPGGTDWGRDADIHQMGSEVPARLMVTASREPKSIMVNMKRGLDSLRKHNLPYDELVLANLGKLNERQRQTLRDEAASQGARIRAFFDRTFFKSKLRHDGFWRKRLLGLSGDPISLSEVPTRLAESPWAQLPLVGRERELAAIAAAQADLIVSGVPGVGKTRLLAELQDTYFVDGDSTCEQLADDIRWTRPRTLVFDDALLQLQLVRCVQRLRIQDDSLANVRLMAICWPQDQQQIADVLADAEHLQVDLLERRHMDQMVRSMGITGVSARQILLDQSEGRPGWAVSLGSLLLSNEWDGVLTGAALVGQVDAFLRRSQFSPGARELLAAIACLRGVTDLDLRRLATLTGKSYGDVSRELEVAARGGLIDVQLRGGGGPDGPIRAISVRPPMLADALAAEAYFLREVPLGDINELQNLWPERILDLTLTVCAAATLGAPAARRKLDSLFSQAEQACTHEGAYRRLQQSYLLVDLDAACTVVRSIRHEFGCLPDSAEFVDSRLDGITELAKLAAFRYGSVDAVRLLLDMALRDGRPTNPNPSHPLRAIQELCESFNPDLAPTSRGRSLVAATLEDWLPAVPTLGQWEVWGQAIGCALGPRARESHVSAGDSFTINIIETVVPPDVASQIHENLWPRAFARLANTPSRAMTHVLESVNDWLRVGSGRDAPFGNAHSDEAVASANEVGCALFHDVSTVSAGHPGVIVRLREIASRFEICLPDDLLKEVESIFWRDPTERHDWRAGQREIAEGIAFEVRQWDLSDAQATIEALKFLRDELAVAGLLWPDRIYFACVAISQMVTDQEAWIIACLSGGLFPSAAPFVEARISESEPIPDAFLDDCLGDQQARWPTVAAMLSQDGDPRLREIAIAETRPTDFGGLMLLCLRHDLPEETARSLLTSADSSTRGAFAVALFASQEDGDASLPTSLRDDWLAGVRDIQPAEIPGVDHHLSELLTYLVSREPDVACDFVSRRIRGSNGVGLYDALGRESVEPLKELPAQHKTQLLLDAGTTSMKRFLLGHLISGTHIDWIEQILDQGIVTWDELLVADSSERRIGIDRLAMLLIPRGVDAKEIAGHAQFGSHFGEQSVWLAELIDEFQTYGQSSDPRVAAVGRAGLALYTQARASAETSERTRRIRGS